MNVAAIERTDAELIYVQDDDCIVSDPKALAKAWLEADQACREIRYGEAGVVCNMPPEFRHSFYEEHALVGFGAVFHRDAPQRAFGRLFEAWPPGDDVSASFNRTCDIVFTALTPRLLVDVPHEDMPWAHHESRMWKQPGHQADRARMLDLVRSIR